MVTYEEFKELIKMKAEETTGNHVAINKIYKNNGLILDGLVIMSMSSNMSPTIFLNSFYGQYKECMDVEEDPIQVIWEEIYKLYKMHMPRESIAVEKFLDFDFVEERIRAKLINYEKNAEWLENIPYVSFLDLAIIFYVRVEDGRGELGSIVVRKDHMEIWKRTEAELLDTAMKNMEDDYQITTMKSILSKFIDDGYGDMSDLDFERVPSIFVLSNGSRINGAITIMCKDVLREFAIEQKCDRVAIIPSSIHETILVPVIEDIDTISYNLMIKAVNAVQLSETEVLSDHLYIYNKDTNKIEIA